MWIFAFHNFVEREVVQKELEDFFIIIFVIFVINIV